MSYRSYRRDKSREPSYPVTKDTTLLPFLLATLKGKSRNNVKSLLARKLVAVDNKPESRVDTPLHAGQTVTILSVSAPFLTGLPAETETLHGSLFAQLTGADTAADNTNNPQS